MQLIPDDVCTFHPSSYCSGSLAVAFQSHLLSSSSILLLFFFDKEEKFIYQIVRRFLSRDGDFARTDQEEGLRLPAAARLYKSARLLWLAPIFLETKLS